MNESAGAVAHELLPFYITGPGETDLLFGADAVTLVAILIGFGALYFTIQAIPDRMVEGAGKAQMQVVGLLGLISLFTMNNAYWIAAILLAAVRIPDIVTPLKQIALARTAAANPQIPADAPSNAVVEEAEESAGPESEQESAEKEGES